MKRYDDCPADLAKLDDPLFFLIFTEIGGYALTRFSERRSCLQPFEGFVIENILALAKDFDHSFYQNAAGAEIYLVLRKGRQMLAFELKFSTVPRVSKGFWSALNDISPDAAYIVTPVKKPYPIKGGAMGIPLSEITPLIK